MFWTGFYLCIFQKVRIETCETGLFRLPYTFIPAICWEASSGPGPNTEWHALRPLDNKCQYSRLTGRLKYRTYLPPPTIRAALWDMRAWGPTVAALQIYLLPPPRPPPQETSYPFQSVSVFEPDPQLVWKRCSRTSNTRIPGHRILSECSILEKHFFHRLLGRQTLLLL